MNGGDVYVYQSNGTTLMTNGGTGAGMVNNFETQYTYSIIDLLNPHGYSNASTLDIDFTINNGALLVGGGSAGDAVDFSVDNVTMNND